MRLQKEHAEKIVPGVVLGYGVLSRGFSLSHSPFMHLYEVKRITPSGRVVMGFLGRGDRPELTINPDMRIRGSHSSFSGPQFHIITEELREDVYKMEVTQRFYYAKKLVFPDEIVKELPIQFFEGLFLSLLERGMFSEAVTRLPEKLPLSFPEEIKKS